jgi:hypothetical protein
MADVHVVPKGEDWAIEVDGKVRSAFETQRDAIDEARGIAEHEGGELVIHGEDGSIREKQSHGNDPSDIPG